MCANQKSSDDAHDDPIAIHDIVGANLGATLETQPQESPLASLPQSPLQKRRCYILSPLARIPVPPHAVVGLN